MSENKPLKQLIEKTLPGFNDKTIIAFLGEVKSGKTVASALLKHTLTTSWIPKSNGKWEAVSSSGYDEINEIIREMQRGDFPAPTPKHEYPKFVTDVYNMAGDPVKHELILHDMSGENYASRLKKPYTDEDDRLMDILSSDGAYIAYAKKYVIMIDCEKKELWSTDPANAGPMIRSIQKIKQRIHNTPPNEKIHSPFAIIFTKSDMLSESDQKKTPEELMKDYYELNSSLNICHDHVSLECFKVYVCSKMETDEEASERVKKAEEKIKKDFESKINTLKQQRDTVVEQAVSAAETQAIAAGQNPEQVQATINSVREKTLTEYDKQIEEEHPQLEQSEKEPRGRIDVPLNYSESEYSRLISWILGTKHDK
jgi:hypothetical protein